MTPTPRGPDREADRQLAAWVRHVAGAAAIELLRPEGRGGGRSSLAQ